MGKIKRVLWNIGYDANGNPVLVENDSTSEVRELYWDEDNRLMVLSDNGKTSRYTYNHSGERIVKSHGTMEGVYINGAPQGITFHETDEFTLYPASIISVNKNRYTKHYFIGSKRVASRIGSGHFNNVYGMNGCNITAGQQDYAERLSQIESQKENYYRELGIAPGIPTMKGSYGDPENTGVGYNTIIKNLGDHSVPAEWAEYVKKNAEANTAPGAPIAWEKASQPEEVQPGYGFIPDNESTEETFYYHSDHLGSTSYVTDDSARITQYTAYLPYGELLVDEHSSSEDMPYKFNGKELDEETGLYYYGARYMNPTVGLFLNPDRYREKYPFLSAYNYCAGNPINMIDVNGDSVVINNCGYIEHYDRNDQDLRVFMNGKCIGSLGGIVDANEWFCNLLDNNAEEASELWNPFTFRNYVKQYGKWDYKYRCKYNNRNNDVKRTQQHILGIAFYLKDSQKGAGELNDTYFNFDNNPQARAEDLNNFHFGVVVKAFNFPLFTEKFILKEAGKAEMEKWADDYKKGYKSSPNVPASWRPTKIIGYSGISGLPIRELQWPYGDNPIDSRWIIRGFNYYRTKIKK